MVVCVRTIPPSGFGRPQLEQPPNSLELQPAPVCSPQQAGAASRSLASARRRAPRTREISADRRRRPVLSGRAAFGGLSLSEGSRQAGQCLSNPKGFVVCPGSLRRLYGRGSGPQAVATAARENFRPAPSCSSPPSMDGAGRNFSERRRFGLAPRLLVLSALRAFPGKQRKGEEEGNEVDGYSSDRRRCG